MPSTTPDPLASAERLLALLAGPDGRPPRKPVHVLAAAKKLVLGTDHLNATASALSALATACRRARKVSP